MKGISIVVVTVASLLTFAACAPKGGGGGHVGAALRPGTITLAPRMITGTGTLTVAPRGDQVALTLHAEALPPPATYSLWLARPGEAPGERLASLGAKLGRIDYTGVYAASRFEGWSEVRVMHQPSGPVPNLSLFHPALIGSLSMATPAR